MLKIRKLKAQQDEAKKAAAAEGGAAAGPKQTPGQLRIQKGACSRPAAWSARTAGPGPTRPDPRVRAAQMWATSPSRTPTESRWSSPIRCAAMTER